MTNEVITVEPIKTDYVEVATKESEQALAIVTGGEFTIVDQRSYENVCNLRREAKKRIKKLEAERKEATGPLDIAKKKVMGWFRRPTDMCLKIIDICNKGTSDWDTKQEAIRIAQQEKLNRQVDAERKKKEEQERVWREKGEAKRREAEALEAEGKKEEATKAQAEADKAVARAEERQEAANGVIAPVIGPAVAKVEGTSYRTDWYGEVVDFKLLPDEYKLPNTAMINKTAKATKGTIVIPGVVMKSKKISVDRG